MSAAPTIQPAYEVNELNEESPACGLRGFWEPHPDADWGCDRELVEWLRGWEPPAQQFRLHEGIYVAEPRRFKEALLRDVSDGPNGVRARYGAVRADLRRLQDLYGGPH